MEKQEIKGKISILISRDSTIIEIRDADANTTFAVVELTPDQLSAALSRLAHVDCKITLRGIDRLGKKHEHDRFEFKMPDSIDKENLSIYAQKLLDNAFPGEGWIAESYFGSKDSFFLNKDNEKMARCTIRRWI